MIALYIMLAIAIVLGVIAEIISIIVLKKNKYSISEGITIDKIKSENDNLKHEMQLDIRTSNSMLIGTLTTQNQHSQELTQRFDAFMTSMDGKFDKLREENSASINALRDATMTALSEVRNDNAKHLDTMKKDNAEQLEKMRQTVDEKLSSTLEQRFNQSFKIVGDRLVEINSTFNALKGLQNDVNDLNKIFKNVKTRGTWGEVSLDSLLSQLLTEDQYIKQAQISKLEGDGGRVDFAIKLPGQGDGTVFLPIDAKFPLEDYQRLVDASSEGNTAVVDACAKALCDAVLKQGRSIRDKYVKPPKTTDFAVMYLPVEGLYAEIVRRTDLLSRLQNEHVVVCGPTTLSALLNSLKMGFRSVAIEKRSKEISRLLEQFQKDFTMFSKYLGQIKVRMNSVQKSIDDAERKSGHIETRLSRVTALDTSDNINLIEDIDSFDQQLDNLNFEEDNEG